jgi:diguanylate cyclase (GGDEF)-like protein
MTPQTMVRPGGYLRWIRNRYFNRKDTEGEQALIRVLIGSIIVGVVLVGAPSDRVVLATCVAGIVVPCAIVLWILAIPDVSPLRRCFGIAADMYFITAAVVLGAPTGSWFVGIYLWVTVGNALRYGKLYMGLAALCSVIGWVFVMQHADPWRSNVDAAIGVLLGLLIVPAYLSSLLGRLERTQEQLRSMAMHDALTGIANRRLVADRLDQAMALAKRLGRSCAVMTFDLDGFKAVNDTLGHDAGDALLRRVVDEIRPRLRSYDTLGRLGGDEFIVVLENVTVPADTLRVAALILHTIEGIKVIGNHPIEISASIGVTAYPDGEANADREQLIQRADEAMYTAKRMGKRQFRFDPRLAGAESLPSR